MNNTILTYITHTETPFHRSPHLPTLTRTHYTKTSSHMEALLHTDGNGNVCVCRDHSGCSQRADLLTEPMDAP